MPLPTTSTPDVPVQNVFQATTLNSTGLTAQFPLLDALLAIVNTISARIPTAVDDFMAYAVAMTTFITAITTKVPQALDAVISYLASFILHTVDFASLNNYFRIMASIDGNMVTPDANPTDPVRPGSSVILTALMPLPGAKLPTSTGSTVDLPAASTVNLLWHIQQPNTGVDLRPALTPEDAGGAYECISGGLTSPVLE